MGGHVYRFFGLPYSSPTIGLFFFADEYIKFLSDLKGFMSAKLKFISHNESGYSAELDKPEYKNVPIGILEYDGKDVEIVFLHYKNDEEAYEKWTRRAKRVNFEHLLNKNSYQNKCSDEVLDAFEKIPFKHKIFFVHKPYSNYDFTIFCTEHADGDCVSNDTTNFRKYVNLYDLINSIYDN